MAELGRTAGQDLPDFLVSAGRGGSTHLNEVSTSWQRLGGYLAAHRDARIEIDPALIVHVGKHSASAAQHSVRALLEGPDRPTALFCADGLMSAGTMAAIVACGLNVPDDLSLVCFDDLDWMAFVGTGIDAIAQPRRRLGKAATALLIARIKGAKGRARNVKLRPRYLSRGSIAPPPEKSIAQ